MRILWPAKCRVVVKLDTGTDKKTKSYHFAILCALNLIQEVFLLGLRVWYSCVVATFTKIGRKKKEFLVVPKINRKGHMIGFTLYDILLGVFLNYLYSPVSNQHVGANKHVGWINP